MPSTGVVDLTPGAIGIGGGQINIIRIGPLVTLSINEVTFTNAVSGWGSVLTLPARFRPPTTMRQNLIDAGSGSQAAVYPSGGLWMNRVSGINYRYIISWATESAFA